MKYDVRLLKGSSVVTQSFEGESIEEVTTLASSSGQVLDVVAAGGKGLKKDIGFKKKTVGPEELAVFSRMFATIIDANQPILKALDVMSKEMAVPSPALSDALASVSGDVRNGHDLADSFSRHPLVFPPLMINIVRAGQTGGFLPKSLKSLADTFEADARLRRDVKAASTYPMAVLGLGVVASWGLLTFGIPVFEQMFTDLGGELPLPTKIAVMLSDLGQKTAIPLIIALAIFFSWWSKNKHTVKVREKLDPIKLKLPIFGPLLRKIAYTRVARIMSVMLDSGVPILQAIEFAAPTAGNLVIEKVFLDAAAGIRLGKPMSEGLEDHPEVPTIFSAMVKVGEESAKLPELFDRLAIMYDEQVLATTTSLSKQIEPYLIAVVGAMIGSIVVAMYMPTFTIMNEIQ